MAPSWMRVHRRRREAANRLGRGPQHDVLIASAALTSKDQVRAAVSRRSDWQRDAWELYDTVPEIRYGINWRANAISRARLYIGRVDPDGSGDPHPVDETDTPNYLALRAPLDELAGGQLGQSQLLKRLSIQYDVAGESWLLGWWDEEQKRNRWALCSVEEVSSDGSGALKIKDPDFPDREIVVDPSSGQGTVIHLWNPHPRNASIPDGPMKALRGPAKELLDISAHIQATAESRLAGAGILKIPDGASLPKPEQSEGANPTNGSDFVATLLQAMAAPLKNRDDASAIVPIIATGDAAALAAMEHLSFATAFDSNALELRESAIRRLAIGMDSPPEVLLGNSDSNHWSAWQTADEALQIHVEPSLQLYCDALNSTFYQPALRDLGVEDWDQWVIWYSLSSLKQRPNRAPEALQAFEKGAISEEAYRREIGFGDEDAPTEAERTRRLLIDLALSNPNFTEPALRALGLPLAPTPTVDQVEVTREPAPALPPGQSDGGTGRSEAPAEPPAGLAALDRWRLTVLDMAVLRALSRAGQWLIWNTPRSKRAELQRMDRHEVHLNLPAQRDQLDDILSGAFLEFYAATPGESCLHNAVNEYVRALLIGGQPHRREYLAPLLKQYGCGAAA